MNSSATASLPAAPSAVDAAFHHRGSGTEQDGEGATGRRAPSASPVAPERHGAQPVDARDRMRTENALALGAGRPLRRSGSVFAVPRADDLAPREQQVPVIADVRSVVATTAHALGRLERDVLAASGFCMERAGAMARLALHVL